MHWRMFSGIPDLYPLDVKSTLPFLKDVQPKMSPDIAKCPFVCVYACGCVCGRHGIALGEKHCSRRRNLTGLVNTASPSANYYVPVS